MVSSSSGGVALVPCPWAGPCIERRRQPRRHVPDRQILAAPQPGHRGRNANPGNFNWRQPGRPTTLPGHRLRSPRICHSERPHNIGGRRMPRLIKLALAQIGVSNAIITLTIATWLNPPRINRLYNKGRSRSRHRGTDDFRSTPINRHSQGASACLKCATNGHAVIRSPRRRGRAVSAKRRLPARGVVR